MKILLLGHNGMLGQAVNRYLLRKDIDVEIIQDRISREYLYANYQEILRYNVIINCIGKIPQTSNDFSLNYNLPIWLEELSGKYCKIIEAGSDCSFSGKLRKEDYYKIHTKLDANSPYGESKARMEKFVTMCNPQRHKIIRTSIIGFDYKESALLSWFLSQKDGETVKGFNNHYWNGVTTVEWAKICYNLIVNWTQDIDYCQIPDFKHYIQVGSNKVSKYQLLNLFNKVFDREIIVEEVESTHCNRCLFPYWESESINKQLVKLRDFYE